MFHSRGGKIDNFAGASEKMRDRLKIIWLSGGESHKIARGKFFVNGGKCLQTFIFERGLEREFFMKNFLSYSFLWKLFSRHFLEL